MQGQGTKSCSFIFRAVFTAYLLLVLSLPSWSQLVVLDGRGDRIIRYEDGTWRYYEGKDSALLIQHTDVAIPTPLDLVVDTVPQPRIIYDYRLFQQYLSAAVRYEAEMLDAVDSVTNLVDRLNDNLRVAKERGDLSEIALVEGRLKAAENLRSTKQRLLSYSRSIIKRTLKVGKRESYKALAKIYIPGFVPGVEVGQEGRMWERQPVIFDEGTGLPMDSQVVAISVVDEALEESTVAEVDPGLRIVRRRESADLKAVDRWLGVEAAGKVALRHCNFAFEGVDPMSGVVKRELPAEVLFSMTPDVLRPHLQGRPYLMCSGHMTSIAGGFRYLTLTIRVASRNAIREFGHIRQGSPMVLTLINGQQLSLHAQADDHGMVEVATGDRVYRVTYAVDYTKEKLLLRSPLDRIRLTWSTGYDDYAVHHVNFILDQLRCLNTKD